MQEELKTCGLCKTYKSRGYGDMGYCFHAAHHAHVCAGLDASDCPDFTRA